MKTTRRIISALTAIAAFVCSFTYIDHDLYAYAKEDTFIPGNGGGYIIDPYEIIPDFSDSQSEDTVVVQASDIPSYYDLRDEGAVTPVRNQGSEGLCHAFSALGACESNILKQGFETDPLSLDLSEAQLGYFLYTMQTDPFDPLYGDYLNTPGKGSDGGNGLLAAAGLAVGIGTEREKFCSYGDWDSGYSEYSRYGGQYRLHTCECMRVANSSADKIKIKRWLMESGAVGVAFYSQRSLYYDNGTSYAYYAKDKSYFKDANHAALIVGWDDDYSKENFSKNSRPSNNGAWLVKNSYGPDLFDDGYFWMSYEDPSAGSFCRYIVEKASEHDDVYEYDGAGYITAYSYGAAANVFTAEYDCALTDVSFYMPSGNPENTKYNIRVYRLDEKNTGDPTDGDLIGTASGTLQCSGYYTVKLDKKAELLKDEQFSLVLTMTAPNKNQIAYLAVEETTALTSTFTIECHANTGESYVYSGGVWEDTTKNSGERGNLGNIPLKAYSERKEEYTPVMLKAALETARNLNIESPLLLEAISIGETAIENAAGPDSCKRAAMTILSVLDKLGAGADYPDNIYADYNVIAGDSDGDGEITIADASELLRVYAANGVMQPYRIRRGQKIAMNIVKDDSIDLSDATEILSIYAKNAVGLL